MSPDAAHVPRLGILVWLLLLLSSPAATAGSRPGLAAVDGVPISSAAWDDARRLASAREANPAAAHASAVAACVRDIVVMQRARAAGLTTVRDEADLRRLHEAENSGRAARLARGEVVHGPRQLGWGTFRRTWFDAMRRGLLAALAETSPPDDEALRAFYAAHPERFAAAGGGLLAFEQHRDFVRRTWLESRLEAQLNGAIARAAVRWKNNTE